MSDEWAKCVKIGIDKYQKEVIPYINDGLFELAGVGIRDSIILLEDGLRDMPPEGATKLYTYELLSRFRLLNEYCREEGLDRKEKESKVKDAMGRIEEKINLAGIGVNAVLKNGLSTCHLLSG